MANKLLIANFNGADGAITYVAETKQVATFIGNAQLDQGIKWGGLASLLLDSAGDHVRFADFPNLSFGTGAFTIRGKFYFHANKLEYLFGRLKDSTGNWNDLLFYSNHLYVYIADIEIINVVFIPDLDIFYDIELGRDASGNVYLFVNGDIIATGINNSDIISNNPFQVGDGGESSFSFNGSIDAFEIYEGCLHTSKFIPPIIESKVGFAYSQAVIIG